MRERLGVAPSFFSEGARKAIEKEEGYEFFELSGKPMDRFAKEHNLSWVFFSGVSSRHSEVAINPNIHFRVDGEEDRFRSFGSDLKARAKGIDVIVGNAADYFELGVLFRERMGESLPIETIRAVMPDFKKFYLSTYLDLIRYQLKNLPRFALNELLGDKPKKSQFSESKDKTSYILPIVIPSI